MPDLTPKLGIKKPLGNETVSRAAFNENWDIIDANVVADKGGVPSIQAGLDAAKPAPGTAGRLYVATDTQMIYRDTGTAWQKVGAVKWDDIEEKPSSFPPSAHKATHAIDGPDALTPADIGAATASDFNTHLAEAIQQGAHGGISPKFLIESGYTFTRNSVAYKTDGTQVASGTPRFETGKFGKAIMVEEGTTNLVQNPRLDTDTSGDGVVDGFVKEYKNNVNPIYRLEDGMQTIEVTNVDTSIASHSWSQISQANIVVNDTAQYSVSVYAKKATTNDYEVISFIFYCYDSNGTFLGEVSSPGYRPTTLTRIKWENITFLSGTAKVKLALRLITNNNLTYGKVWFSKVQFEQKPYATSFIDGTRSAETLTIPTAGVLNPQEGTVECWVYVDPNVHKVTGSGWNMVFVVYDPTAGEPNQLRFGYNRTSGKWHVKTSDSAGTFWHAEYTVASGWHHFALTWNKATTTAKMYVDGVVVASNTAAPLPSAFASIAYIGLWLNSLIDDLRISSIARTDAEISDAYNSGLPLLPDKDTTWWSGFDNNTILRTDNSPSAQVIMLYADDTGYGVYGTSYYWVPRAGGNAQPLFTFSSSFATGRQIYFEVLGYISGSATAYFQLYDITSGTGIVMLSTTSSSPTLVRSSAITIPDGHQIAVGYTSSSVNYKAYLLLARLIIM